MSCEGCQGCQGRCRKRPPQKVAEPPLIVNAFEIMLIPLLFLFKIAQAVYVRKQMAIARNQITKAMIKHMTKFGVRPDQIAKIIQKAKTNGM